MDGEDGRRRRRRVPIEEGGRAAPITGDPGSLERLCTVTVRACQLMRPLISAIYDELGRAAPSASASASDDDGGASSAAAATAAAAVVQKAKEDGSAFTIADGLVQRLLVDELFSRIPFRDVVGEEEDEDEDEEGAGGGDGRDGAAVDDDDDERRSWSRVSGLIVPMHLRAMVESTRSSVRSLAEESLPAPPRGGGGSSSGSSDDDDVRRRYYRDLTVFIDPIDGTREFSTGTLGGQCSVCVGFANGMGRAVGGVVYRPLPPSPSTSGGGGGGGPSGPTWAAGARSEGYAACDFGRSGGGTPDDDDGDDDEVGGSGGSGAAAASVAEIVLEGRGGGRIIIMFR